MRPAARSATTAIAAGAVLSLRTGRPGAAPRIRRGRGRSHRSPQEVRASSDRRAPERRRRVRGVLSGRAGGHARPARPDAIHRTSSLARSARHDRAATRRCSRVDLFTDRQRDGPGCAVAGWRRCWSPRSRSPSSPAASSCTCGSTQHVRALPQTAETQPRRSQPSRGHRRPGRTACGRLAASRRSPASRPTRCERHACRSRDRAVPARGRTRTSSSTAAVYGADPEYDKVVRGSAHPGPHRSRGLLRERVPPRRLLLHRPHRRTRGARRSSSTSRRATCLTAGPACSTPTTRSSRHSTTTSERLIGLFDLYDPVDGRVPDEDDAAAAARSSPTSRPAPSRTRATRRSCGGAPSPTA